MKRLIGLSCFLALIITASGQHTAETGSTIVSNILTNENSYFYLNTENYPERNKSLPIGVFDSGTGGLTVLDAIVNFDQHNNSDQSSVNGGDGIRDFQGEYFIYLGDQANMPYGNYSRENKLNLLQEHIIKDVQFLMGNKYYPSPKAEAVATDKESVKAIVIACNTATAYGKDEIEDFARQAGIDLKIIGVIDAGVRAAVDGFDTAQGGTVAVMATAGTVSSRGYVKALQKQWNTQGYAGEPGIFQQAGIGLAGAIDGASDFISPDAAAPRSDYKGPSITHPDALLDPTILPRYNFDWDDGKMLYRGSIENPQDIQLNSIPNYIAYHVVTLLEQIRRNGQSKPLQSIILGCTHYPYYTDIFQQNLERLYNYQENGQYSYRPSMAENIELIDPALNTAAELYGYLCEQQLFNQSHISQSEFYISVPNADNPSIQIDQNGNFTYDYKYGRSAGQIQQYVKRVPFSQLTIDAAVVLRLQNGTPDTWELIESFNHNNTKLIGLNPDYLF